MVVKGRVELAENQVGKLGKTPDKTGEKAAVFLGRITVLNVNRIAADL